MGFEFLDKIKQSLMQNFSPENGQTNSSGANPLQGMAPSMPPAQSLPSPQPQPQPQGRDQLMPAQPEIPSSLSQVMPQPQGGSDQNPIADNPGGISLQELIILGAQSYLQQLLGAPGQNQSMQGPTPDTNQAPMPLGNPVDVQTAPMQGSVPNIPFPVKDQSYYQNNTF